MKTFFIVLIALIVGAGGGFGATKLLDNPKPQVTQKADTQKSGDPQTTLSSEILSELRAKKGAEFDKAFLTELMSHDQTAIEMANLAQERTERAEIKKWAQYVSEAQISDISQMKTWYNDWGFLKEDQQSDPHAH